MEATFNPKVSRKVQKSIDALDERYQIGQDANRVSRTCRGKSRYGVGAIGRFADRDGSSRSFVYDSRQIASSYSREELDQVIELSKVYNFAVGPSHLIELMRLDPDQRRVLQENTARGRWPVARLKKEIASLKTGKRSD